MPGFLMCGEHGLVSDPLPFPATIRGHICFVCYFYHGLGKYAPRSRDTEQHYPLYQCLAFPSRARLAASVKITYVPYGVGTKTSPLLAITGTILTNLSIIYLMIFTGLYIPSSRRSSVRGLRAWGTRSRQRPAPVRQ